MRPFPRSSNLNENQERFNNCLSKARRTIENVFGIMSMRFRVLINKMHVNVENAKKVTLSVCILHNLLIDANSTRRSYISSNSNNNDRPQLLRIEQTQSRNPSHQAKMIREKFVNYFNNLR